MLSLAGRRFVASSVAARRSRLVVAATRDFGLSRRIRKETSEFEDRHYLDDQGNVVRPNPPSDFDAAYGLDGDEDGDDYMSLEDEEYNAAHVEYQRRKGERDAANQRDLAARKGRLWEDPWELSDEFLASSTIMDDLPDWTPAAAHAETRAAVRVEDVPTLEELASSTTAALGVDHPTADRKRYAKHAVRRLRRRVRERVSVVVARGHLMRAVVSASPEAAGDVVDELYETVQKETAKELPIVAKHPSFFAWTERALELYLEEFRERYRVRMEENSVAATAEKKDEKDEKESAETTRSNSLADAVDDLVKDDRHAMSTTPTTKSKDGNEGPSDPLLEIADEIAEELRDEAREVEQTPYFLDFMESAVSERRANIAADDAEHAVKVAKTPNLPRVERPPLDPDAVLSEIFPHCNLPRLIREEWDLSAHDETRRIMVRRCTTDVAKALTELDERQRNGEKGTDDAPLRDHVHVTGRRGVGKSMVLLSVVAAARKSGHVVLYLPDAARLTEFGSYIVPAHVPGTFNNPVLSQELCAQLLAAHGDQLEQAGLAASREDLEIYFSPRQLERLRALDGVDDDVASDVPLKSLLLAAAADRPVAGPAYSVVVRALRRQTKLFFLAVLDEVNVYNADHAKGKGHYFHKDHDEKVRRSIPYENVNLFAPFLDSDADADADAARGALLTAPSLSRPVPKSRTAETEERARARENGDGNGRATTVVEVKPYSDVEMRHVLANYECVGVGNFRFDEGRIVRDEQEVAFRRMFSGGVGAKVLDSAQH